MSDLEVYRAALGFVRVIKEALDDPKALEDAAQNISRLSKQEQDKLDDARKTIASAQSVKDSQDAAYADIQDKKSALNDANQKLLNDQSALEYAKNQVQADKQKNLNDIAEFEATKSSVLSQQQQVSSVQSSLQAREDAVFLREKNVTDKESKLQDEEQRLSDLDDQIKSKAQKLKELVEG